MTSTSDIKRIIETVIICAVQPIQARDLRVVFEDEFSTEQITTFLTEIQQDWVSRGVALVQVASGWRFQSRPEMSEYLDRMNPEKPQRYTRAALETLAIIAYKQPVTRGDIEDVRGVTVNSQILKQLEDRGWIEVIGQRQTIGRPDLFATTRDFLDDLSLTSLDQLPEMDQEALLIETIDSLASTQVSQVHTIGDSPFATSSDVEKDDIPGAEVPAQKDPQDAPVASFDSHNNQLLTGENNAT